jgi:WXG100 family type VII secretion target
MGNFMTDPVAMRD